MYVCMCNFSIYKNEYFLTISYFNVYIVYLCVFMYVCIYVCMYVYRELYSLSSACRKDWVRNSYHNNR